MKKMLFGLISSLICFQIVSAEPLKLVTDMSYPPFQFMDGGELKGVEAEILAEISKRTGLEFEPKKIAFDKIFYAVEHENADIAMSAIDITPERLENFDFSEAYYVATNIFVAPGNKFNSKSDLAGSKVGVISPKSTQEEIAKNIENVEVVVCKSLTNAISFLNSGKIDALIVESVAAPIVIHNQFEYLSESEKQGLDMLKSFGALKKVEVFHVDFEGSMEQGLMVKKENLTKNFQK